MLEPSPNQAADSRMRTKPQFDRRGQAALFGVLALAMALAASLTRGVPLDLYGWIPLAAAVVVVLVVARDRVMRGAFRGGSWSGFGVRRAAVRAWLPALAIPGAVLSAGYLAACVLGDVRMALPPQGAAWFAGVSVAIVVVGSIEAIGEELGWRGYLLPRIAAYGRVRAGLASGVLWAVWHTPLIYIAAAYHPGAGPIYFAAFAATIVAMSFIANELRMASGSSWPAVIFHGAHNAIWYQLQSLVVVGSASLNRIGGESGVVPLALYAAVAAWIVWRRPSWPRTDAVAGEVNPAASAGIS